MDIKAFVDLKKKVLEIPLSYWLAALLSFLFLFVISYYSIDPDFGWHLKSGLYYLRSGIPKVDIFTYTASNFPWINHEWLNDILIAITYNIGEYKLVAALFASIWTAAFVIASRKRNAFVLIVATISVTSFVGIRPVAWTVLFVAFLERIMNSQNKRYGYLLPILFLFWANLHGSFVLGLGLLALWQIFTKKRLPWVPVLLSFAVVFINPYGPRIFEEIVRTAADSKLRYRISEWQMIVLPALSLVYVVIFAAYHLVFNKKPIKSMLSIPGLMFTLTLSSIRHMPVFVATSMRYLENYFDQFIKQLSKLKLNNIKVGLLIFIVGLPILIFIYYAITSTRQVVVQNNSYPTKAIIYLGSKNCSGNLFNSYNFGGYLIWKLPEQKVYIDGRMPSWKLQNTDYFKNYEEVFANDEFRREEFTKYNIRCVLISKRDELFKLKRAVPFGEQLQKEGWGYIKEASTNDYSLFIKELQ